MYVRVGVCAGAAEAAAQRAADAAETERQARIRSEQAAAELEARLMAEKEASEREKVEETARYFSTLARV